MNISFNGKQIQTQAKTVFALCKDINLQEKIVILNGFALTQDHLLQENDQVVVIVKGKFPPRDQLEAMLSARHTPHVYEKLKRASVAIAGLGGLGSHIAIALARLGVGHLLLVDFDIVEPSNLNRQSYYIDDLGKPKTIALQQQIARINPFIHVDAKQERVTEKNVISLFGQYPIVCEAFDTPSTKAMLVNTLLEFCPNTTIVAASGMAGYTSANFIKTERRMKRLYVCGDFENEAKIGNGLMAPRVQICAGHQANMVLRLLLKIEEA